MQVVLNLAGLALIPLITAVVVDGIVNARLALHTGRLQPARVGHVVVIGLGNVGTRVMAQLREYDVEVVAIDKNPEPRGGALARQLEVPLIVGDAALPETLASASVADCQALVVVVHRRRGQPGGGAGRPGSPRRPAGGAATLRR